MFGLEVQYWVYFCVFHWNCNSFPHYAIFLILTLHQAVFWLDLILWRWPQKQCSQSFSRYRYFIASESKYVWIHESALFFHVASVYVPHISAKVGMVALYHCERNGYKIYVCVCIFWRLYAPASYSALACMPAPAIDHHKKHAVLSALVWWTMVILWLIALMGKCNISRRVSNKVATAKQTSIKPPTPNGGHIHSRRSQLGWPLYPLCKAHPTESAGCLQDST